MAKKVRRVRRPSSSESAPAVPPAKPGTTPRATAEDELRDEYAYVLRDLRRVFVLAAIMFLLLIALNLLA